MVRQILTFVTIVLEASGCVPGEGVSAKKNDRSTREEIQAAATAGTDTASGSGSGTGTGSGAGTDDGGPAIQPDASLTYFKDTKALFAKYCVSCHDTAPTGGAPEDIDLTTYDNVGGKIGVYGKRDRIQARVEAGSMPIGQTMTDEDKTKLVAWILAGAPLGVDPAEGQPAAAFVNPAAAAEQPTNGTFTIRVAFSNVPEEAYYDLFYSDTEAVTGGEELATDIPVSDVTTPWNTKLVSANGDYHVYLILYDGEGTKLTSLASKGTVHVDNSTPTNHAPTVALTGAFAGSAAASATINPSTTIQIPFVKADVDGDPVTVTIEYRESGTGAFTPVVTDYAGASPYNWTSPPSLNEGIAYRFKITASDGELTAAYTSAGAVGVTTVDYTVAGAFSTEVLNPNCESSGCHAGKGSGFDSDSASSAHDYADAILSRVNSGNMPKTGGPLSPGDKAKVQLWYWQGKR